MRSFFLQSEMRDWYLDNRCSSRHVFRNCGWKIGNFEYRSEIIDILHVNCHRCHWWQTRLSTIFSFHLRIIKMVWSLDVYELKLIQMSGITTYFVTCRVTGYDPKIFFVSGMIRASKSIGFIGFSSPVTGSSVKFRLYCEYPIKV